MATTFNSAMNHMMLRAKQTTAAVTGFAFTSIGLAKMAGTALDASPLVKAIASPNETEMAVGIANVVAGTLLWVWAEKAGENQDRPQQTIRNVAQRLTRRAAQVTTMATAMVCGTLGCYKFLDLASKGSALITGNGYVQPEIIEVIATTGCLVAAGALGCVTERLGSGLSRPAPRRQPAASYCVGRDVK